MGFAAGYGVDLDGVDDVGEGDDEIGGVFLWGFFLMSRRFFRTGAGREKGGGWLFLPRRFCKRRDSSAGERPRVSSIVGPRLSFSSRGGSRAI